MRFFNTAGPCEPDRHYMIPAVPRLPEAPDLIERGGYFVVHAPRQTGKTTTLRALAHTVTAQGRYTCLYLSCKAAEPSAGDVRRAQLAILDQLAQRAEANLPPELRPPQPFPDAPDLVILGRALRAWSMISPRPLVLFLDEIDTLTGDALRSVLAQLHSGYPERPREAPWSVVLCGLRDVRDYRQAAGKDPGRFGSASPFTSAIADAEQARCPDIKLASLRLGDFTAAEVRDLYAQHTADTGQVFAPEAAARAFDLTRGQPWLVNALGARVTEELVPERAQPISAADIDRAAEILILRRDTHLDSLAEKLREDRVRRIVETILTGAAPQMDVLNDDLLYVRDLGLVAPDAPVRIANPIYQEIIPRSLSHIVQEYLPQRAAWYLQGDGSLDMVLLLASFQEFFVEHSEAWLARFDYQEAGPHLLLMAFLQRIFETGNGGGHIHRELAAGSGRADLVVSYGGRRSVLELKLRRGPDTEREALRQLGEYLDRLGEPEGYLVIFDRRRGVPWSEKLSLHEAAGPDQQRIYVFGM